MKKLQMLLVICLVMVFTLTACSQPADTSAKAEGGSEAEQPKQEEVAHLVISTGGTSGSYYPVGGAIANVVSKYAKGVNITAQTSGGSIENLKLIEKGQSEFGLAQNDLADYAIKGIQLFDTKLEKIRAIAALYPEYIQIAVRTDKGINSISDLKGKKISVGAPGSGSEANCRQFLELLGVPYESFEPQFLENTDAANQFKDNVIDGFIITSGLPSPAIQEIATTKGVKIIGFSKEEAEKINKQWPFLTAEPIPANSYKDQTEELITMAAKSAIFVSADVSEDVVYKFTKALWENQTEMEQANAKAKHMKKDNPLEGITVEPHPGALKYYNEIGVKVN
ncbi:MAG: TAXI family TRAP transporter solute-binding subunit [Clostridiaceae bacterium]|nr:TAXI family TRAP transporter solute-binding subunit [Clostridiaceae bacterium]